MPRSDIATFVNDKPEKPKLAYCSKCQLEKSMLNKLVPLLEEDGIPNDKFRVCCVCGHKEPIHEMKYESLYEPKGYLDPNQNPFSSGTQVTAMRKKRVNKSNKIEGIEEVDVPKLAGKEDTELEDIMKMKERPAILNMLEDQEYY